ncbi:MAG: hypothetical protein EP350_06340 [Alphaproteobacteria bacterium]|nr:MAG: hypothetical protein EP350_06340 [Alphaproteobacteria bacterium]
MKKWIALLGVAALAACQQAEAPAEDEATTEAATPEAPSIAGTYEETNAEGKVVTTSINEDGTYTESIDGAVTESGTWSQADGQDCFDPEGDEAPTRCFSTSEMAEDGTFTATPVDGGDPITVKKTG